MTESCIKINGTNTEWFQTFKGVHQGDILSPKVFALFINDLASKVKNMLNLASAQNSKHCVYLKLENYIYLFFCIFKARYDKLFNAT